MAILTFSATPTKNGTATVTLDKSELYALAPISGDAFWSDPDNVKQVKVVYQSSVGTQDKVLTFDAQVASPQDEISFSQRPRNNFQVMYIVLNDYDNGELRLDNATLGALISVSSLGIQFSSSIHVYMPTLSSENNVGPGGGVDQIAGIKINGVNYYSASFNNLNTIQNGWAAFADLKSSLATVLGSQGYSFQDASGYGNPPETAGFTMTGPLGIEVVIQASDPPTLTSTNYAPTPIDFTYL